MKKIDTSRIKTYSVKGRESKVQTGDFAKPHQKGASFKDFFSSLPDILASRISRTSWPQSSRRERTSVRSCSAWAPTRSRSV